MRLKIALLCALVVPLGTAKADVTTFSNSNGTGTQSLLTLFIIKFTTANFPDSAFSLGNINIRGTGAANTGDIFAKLYDASGQLGSTVTGAYTHDTKF